VDVIELDSEQFDKEAAELGVCLPIEQTDPWYRYQATVEGRRPWAALRFDRDGSPVAFVRLTAYAMSKYNFLRAAHGPVWVGERTDADEAELLDALRAFVKERDKEQVFVRLAVAGEHGVCRKCFSSLPYDRTVVIDVTGGDEEILSRMKPRGRRDVRKSLREAPVECADETERATESFSEYYEIMVDTAKRDGFVPAPESDYQDMIRTLGPEHCRVYAGRTPEGVVDTWSIVTIQGNRATRYYAASRSESMRMHVTDKLVYFECCDLGAFNDGQVSEYDLMGVGSDFAPELMGLNEFKTKFTKSEPVEVAPDRDLPVKSIAYKALATAYGLAKHGN
jgi:lipid II:glycine glycyltransferase (peptidoglycan interpeptide bridge formation enzyme)